MVLHRLPLPIATLGDIEPLGLGLWAWCTRCKRERRVPVGALLSVRPFAGARFRCSTCGDVGYPVIRPPVRRRADEAAGLADIYCEWCVPPWSILEVDSCRQPWKLMSGQAFTCPGCRRPAKYIVRQAPWRPTYAPRPEF
jgi:hypothetical protein